MCKKSRQFTTKAKIHVFREFRDFVVEVNYTIADVDQSA